jgi:nucleoid-associated protein EbfC
MFDKFKAMSAMASLMQNKDKLKAAGQRIKEQSQEVRATGESGGGAVRVTVNGQMKVLSVELAPALISGMAADDQTRDLAGSLIAEAVNNASALAQAQVKSILEKEARELGLPDLPTDITGLLT